jgi:DNA-directed RNA polymerase subunit H (RpoH/RPB5)
MSSSKNPAKDPFDENEIEYVYRSRLTLMELLGNEGYNVEPFSKFSPAEISVCPRIALNFTAKKMDDEESKCLVRYEKYTRQKLADLNFIMDENGMAAGSIPEKTVIIIMKVDPVIEAEHHIAYSVWMKTKVRLYFFHTAALGINPLKHVFVPKHEILPQEDHKQLLESLYLTSKTKLPVIRFHIDPITRCIFAKPGDIIKITRPSPSAGVYVVYRICAP